MEKLELKAQNRKETGKQISKLRTQGLIPAVLYGKKIQNINLSVNAGEFEKLLKKAGESTLVELFTEDNKKHSVIIHDVQYHFLKSHPIHVDFYEVSMTEKLKATVALEFTGESKAVKMQGGVLMKLLSDVEVECLPADLPHSITVDISKLDNLNDAVHIKDLVIPAKVKVLAPGEEIVAKVQPPRSVEAELPTEVSEADKVAEVIAASTQKKEEEVSAEDKK